MWKGISSAVLLADNEEIRSLSVIKTKFLRQKNFVLFGLWMNLAKAGQNSTENLNNP